MAPLFPNADIVEKLSHTNVFSNDRISRSFSDTSISERFLKFTFFSNQNNKFKIARPSFKWAFLKPLNSQGFFLVLNWSTGHDIDL